MRHQSFPFLLIGTFTVLITGLFAGLCGCGEREQPAPRVARPSANAPLDFNAPDYKPVDIYTDLRKQVLALKPKELGVPENQPLAVLMEIGNPQAVVTLVVIVDGTTSLYFSNGGGLIGAGEKPPVRKVALDFLNKAEAVADRLQSTTETPFPKRGRVRFYLISADTIRTAEAAEQDLGNNRHELSPLFHAGHGVITAVRENTPEEK